MANLSGYGAAVLHDPGPVPSSRSRLYDPAKDAARLLGWFGLTVLMVGAPLVSVLSTRALYVLLPVGAAILAAAYLLLLSKAGLRSFRDALSSPIGSISLFVAGWAALSLVWTPFPETAAPRCLATIASALVAALIVAHIPERRASSTLYLLPAGVTLTALAAGGLTLWAPASFRGGTEFEPSLVERSAIILSVLTWPALGCLGAFARWRSAMAMAVLAAAALFAASAPIVMGVFALTAVLVAGAPKKAAAVAATLTAGLVMLAPLLPFVLAPLALAVPNVGRSTIEAMADWRNLVAEDGVRLITGHGLDAARQGVAWGLLPPHTPRSILFELWYDLGVLGAFAVAAGFAFALLAAGQAAANLAPFLIGGIVASGFIAFFGVATDELWYVTLVSLEGIAFGLLARSNRGGRLHLRRPDELDPTAA